MMVYAFALSTKFDTAQAASDDIGIVTTRTTGLRIAIGHHDETETIMPEGGEYCGLSITCLGRGNVIWTQVTWDEKMACAILWVWTGPQYPPWTAQSKCVWRDDDMFMYEF